jgi:two-component system, cell cycle response regulator DivK
MKKRVLIIEDNKKNMQLERDLLEVAGWEVLEALDGASGIALAQKEKPDVIVLDVRLPDIRGPEVAGRLREAPETRDIPIIFVTASVVGAGMEEIRAIPDTMFLTKPVNTRTFAEEVSRCIPGGSHG